MAKVAEVARSLFRTVASIYKPFSVKAFVAVLLFGDTFVVEIFDRKSRNSLSVNRELVRIVAYSFVYTLCFDFK